MHVDPADVWEARLRDAPAASAAEAILSALLGYRDSHVLHADDVAQLASALEAWGTLVLGGARPDGSPFVPPTSDERASAAASLEAIAFAERDRSAAVAALAAHVSAKGVGSAERPQIPLDPYTQGYWRCARGEPRPTEKGWAQIGWDDCHAELANENTATPVAAQPAPNAPTSHEIEVLQMVAGERPWAPWGAWIGACMEFLQEGGYLTGGPTLTARITAKGRAALAALKPDTASQHTGAPDA